MAPAIVEPAFRVATITPVVNPNLLLGDDPSTEPAFSIQFNRAVNAVSLSNQDFEFEQVNADGTTTPIAQRQDGFVEATDPADSTAQSLLVSVRRPLDPGNYQLVLLGSNSLQDLAGQSPGQADQVLTTFTISSTTTDSPGGPDLGTLAAGSNDLSIPVGTTTQGGPLTEVTLTGGLTWNLSSRFAEQAPDNFQISLFDDQQHLLASVPGSEVMNLDQDLTSGTYYLQVNQIATSSAAAAGSLGLTLTGTTITDAAPVVLSVRPINANLAAAAADSIVVQFGGSSVPASFLTTSQSIYSLVDGNGRDWEVDPLAYDPATNQLVLALPGYLPTGHYQLEATLDRAADSLAPTVVPLGSFDAVSSGLAASDLGTVFLQGSSQVATGPVELAPGESITRQFSIIQARQYQVALSSPDVDVEVFRVASDGTHPVANSGLDDPSGLDYELAEGVYELVATNRATSARSVAVTIHAIQTSDESLSLGGVGQMPALAGNTTLLTGSAPSTGFTLGGPTPISTVDSMPSERTAAVASPAADASVEARGSFSLQALDLAPVGSLSNPAATASSQPISGQATLAIALNSSIMVNPIASPLQPTGSRRVGAPTPRHPLAEGVVEIDARPGPALDSTLPTQPTAAVPATERLDPVEMIAGVTDVAADDLGPDALASTGVVLQTGLMSRLFPEPEADSLAEPVQVASLASPAGLILAGCVIYRQVKRARSGAAPSPWRRPWDRPVRNDRASGNPSNPMKVAR